MKRTEVVTDIVGGLVVLAVFTFAVILLAPITILRDWRITVPNTVYHLGGTIQLHTTSHKLRKAGGPVERTIECDKGKDSTVSYPLNNSQAKGAPGLNHSTYELKIPLNITNLPTTCRVVIAVDYQIYGFRHITENTVSNDFRVVQ